jgi:hypothetical protein
VSSSSALFPHSSSFVRRPGWRGVFIADLPARLSLLCLVGTLASCSSKAATAPADNSTGSGTAAGTISGHSYDSVGDSRWVGAPDDAAHTRVIYVFDKPVSCDTISAAGWDQAVTDGTQSLEMKLLGTTAAAYPIPASGHPATGEATVNYTITSTKGTPTELAATAGTVTVDELVNGKWANGSFDLTIPGGAVSGTFHATYCATGREP